jgi:hypothetical protein
MTQLMQKVIERLRSTPEPQHCITAILSIDFWSPNASPKIC